MAGSNCKCIGGVVHWWIIAVFLLATSISVIGCGEDDTASDERWETQEDDDENQEEDNNQEEPEEPGEPDPPTPTNDPPTVAVAIETILHSPTTMTAGDRLQAECRFLDPAGEVIEYDEDDAPGYRILKNPNNAFEDDIATKVGRAEITCQSPALGLTDPSPIEVLIEPGPVHTTTTTLSSYQMVAGENVEATCRAFDAYGNPVDDISFTLLADTSGSGIAIDNQNLSVSITRTGLYTFNCHVEGVRDIFGDTVEVIPDLPSELLVNVIPFQSTYGIGQVITMSAIAQDRFGNEVPTAFIEITATPPGETFGVGRFRFSENGLYVLRAEVTSGTHDDIPLIEEVEVIVNDSGPAINCTEPYDNQMVDHNPGSNLTIAGTAADEFGIEEIFIDGESVSFDDEGNFSTTIQPRYGINFVDIVARDTLGEESVRTCTYLVSNSWAAPAGYINDAVNLRLSQDAIDDKANTGSLRSLNDIILAVINSDGLRQTILDALQEQHPYDVDYCDFDLYVQGISYVGAPHVTSIDLIGGGLRLFARLNDVEIRLRLTNGSSWWNATCWGSYNPVATLSFVETQLTSNVDLIGNTPRINLREVEFVRSGSVSLSGGNWFSSAIYSALDSLFQGTLRGLIEDTFEDAVSDNFNDLFDDLMRSLDVDSLAGDIEVPRLDNDDTLSLNFGFRFSTVNANSSRLLFGLAPRIVPPSAAHAIPTEGVAHPSGSIQLAPSGDTVSAAVHVSLLNQALHSLWRGGLFHANIGSALFGDEVPDGTSVMLQTQLPPLAVLEGDDSATIMLGGLRMSLAYPGLFDQPIFLNLGATATTRINLNGDELSFEDITIDEFHFSPEEVSLTEDTRDILEDFLRGLIQDVIDQSLNAALPSLPIPSFTIPASMATYDLPAGESFGVTGPSMEQTIRHIILRGEFGIQ